MGGTFLSTKPSYQKKFMLGCFQAVSGKRTNSLSLAKKACEKSDCRITGTTFETRPDYCGKEEVNRMLDFGGTRVELGVQNIDDEIYKKISRGHSVQDVVNATALLKDSAFKIAYHFMPGLPHSNEKKDLKNFKKLFSDSRFKPDMLKIYPCLVIEGTKLFSLYKKGEFEPISTARAAKLIAKMKTVVPKYVRIMRVQRDIPSTIVSAGVDKTNLRQLVEKELHEQKIKCNCIRCREAALQSYLQGKKPSLEKAKIIVEEYDASKGKEFFVSLEQKNFLFGYCRLRFPFEPFRKEIDNQTALVRELRVFSEVVPIGEKPLPEQFQHRGVGKKLLSKAEQISQDFGSKELTVLSGIGVKDYYRKLGFFDNGCYLTKKL
jgi:elongator complex protein 3